MSNTQEIINKETITEWFKGLQDHICTELEKADQKGIFKEDKWERDGGGGGRSRVIENGAVIEKGGVNFSAVHGETPQRILEALKLEKSDFYATGVSIVLHPQSPMIPIIHMNVRYFEMSNGVKWLGGGIDLTPHYVDKQDAQHFHQALKKVCDKHSTDYYLQFKKWADDYFYIKHRNETRGVGGIFFDHLKPTDNFSFAQRWDFVKEVGMLFAPVYTHFMNKNRSLSYGEKESAWQKIRRGRYVEFNLVWDKGTKFGLDTNGRTESILMSMPPQANWEYNYQTENGSREQETLDLLKKNIDWLNIL